MYELFSAFFPILTFFSLKPLNRNHSYIMVYYVFLIRVCDDHSATWHFYSLCVTIAGEVPLLDDVTPSFYRTEVSAHGPIFCRMEPREIIGAILYRSKSQRTRTDFHSDFKIGPCALGITLLKRIQSMHLSIETVIFAPKGFVHCTTTQR